MKKIILFMALLIITLSNNVSFTQDSLYISPTYTLTATNLSYYKQK